MKVELYKGGRTAKFVVEDAAFSGVKKVAEKVCRDVYLVTGAMPELTREAVPADNLVIAATVGKSALLAELEQRGCISLQALEGKREVYQICVLEHPFPNVAHALVIAGSDKRGTIYGLFHLSELMGVSPFVDWCSVLPKKQEEVCFDESINMVSREPSVRFRGFFINDEWPAFGNWCNQNFGGFNAAAYEHVFELLLRLKGNYLWPAMWSARFEDDGPGLANAELADEYGVVMGMSHHEPCLRQGEEYRYLRGKDSIYGDAWNFRTNKEGITRFWEDGLKRSGAFENVITVGMRGEADTAILGKNATLADNIELLRDVLKTQRRLIQENVREDLSEVPRMIALYKEVEEFFYGTEDVKGLMGCEELEDVILMLCDDNYGNLRTLPTEQMRQHKGGYGMYYHFDYHGWPISYEWINSSYLPKIWEQMSMAYDFGVRDLWIVNVGDIATQEFPLSYFLNLAYDFDTYGTRALGRTQDYTLAFAKQQFGGMFSEADCEIAAQLLDGYTRIAHRRRPEAMNAQIYHPVNGRETRRTIEEIDLLFQKLAHLSEVTPPEMQAAFTALLAYPVAGTMNLYRMQLYAGLNHYYAKLGAVRANVYADAVEQAFRRDRELVEQYHTVANGKFYGFGMSEHIGFTHWNEDECQNPTVMRVLPAKKPRIVVCDDASVQRVEGSPWNNQTMRLEDFLEPDVSQTTFSLYNVSDLESAYEIQNPHSWLHCEVEREDGEKLCVKETPVEGQMRIAGTLDGDALSMVRVRVTIDRAAISEGEKTLLRDGTIQASAELRVITPAGKCIVVLPVLVDCYGGNAKYAQHTFLMTRGYVSIEAGHYGRCMLGKQEASFQEILPYGKTVSAMKVFPTEESFETPVHAPYVEYYFTAPEAGSYEAELYMQPSNPVTNENKLLYQIQCNEGELHTCNAIEEGQKVGDMGFVWGEGVLNNIRRKTTPIVCQQGINCLRIYAVTPGFVLEKLVIYPKGKQPGDSFLGPQETYYIGREQE